MYFNKLDSLRSVAFLLVFWMHSFGKFRDFNVDNRFLNIIKN